MACSRCVLGLFSTRQESRLIWLISANTHSGTTGSDVGICINEQQQQIKPDFPLCSLLAKSAEGLCSLLSPSVVQWDAMTVFMECMIAQIFKNLEEEVKGAILKITEQKCVGQNNVILAIWSLDPLLPCSVQKLPIDQSMELLQAVLNYETKDPLILSCVLTNVSALFPFVTRRQHFLPQILYKVGGVFTDYYILNRCIHVHVSFLHKRTCKQRFMITERCFKRSFASVNNLCVFTVNTNRKVFYFFVPKAV